MCSRVNIFLPHILFELEIPVYLSNITLTKRNHMFVAHDITNLDCDTQQGRLGGQL